MEYEIKNLNTGYKPGQYLVDESNSLYQVIYDDDRGYALLDVQYGTLSSEFYESMEDFIAFTIVTSMRFVKQENKIVFTIQP